MGNLVFRKTARNSNPIMAMAGRITIAEAEEIVEIGELDPELIACPGVFVNYVVQSAEV
jgi:acyl CoA:acetate/3-ketoacid CoA transferase alpha subunit